MISQTTILFSSIVQGILQRSNLSNNMKANGKKSVVVGIKMMTVVTTIVVINVLYDHEEEEKMTMRRRRGRCKEEIEEEGYYDEFCGGDEMSQVSMQIRRMKGNDEEYDMNESGMTRTRRNWRDEAKKTLSSG